MDNNIWSIDKIENNIALLENINTQEKKEINLYSSFIFYSFVY